ncbi:MAG TPA: hypothetical protein VFL57_17415 [Bryobacteraceae bacterium]|nr:hypothetical protein [Bryobacteraceae bacterium]
MRNLSPAAVAALIGTLCLPAAPKDPSRVTTTARTVTEGKTSTAIRPLAAISSPEDLAGSGARPTAASKQLRLVKPFGIAVDDARRMFVADPGQGAVLVYDRQARTAVRWTGNAKYPLLGPAGLAFGSAGRLFVSDSYRPRVVVFDKSGSAIASFGEDQLKRPGAVAVDANRGRVYVADVMLRQVLSFDERTFAKGKTLGEVRDAAGSRRSVPAGLGVNSRGQLYVVDRVNCRVQIYDPDGSGVSSFGTLCMEPGEFARPSSIAIDDEDHVYIADAELGSLQVLSADGRNVLFAASLGRGPGLSVLRTGIALDGDRRVYLAQQTPDGGSIQIFDKVPERGAQLRGTSPGQTQR